MHRSGLDNDYNYDWLIKKAGGKPEIDKGFGGGLQRQGT
jgi:hypothetical protein